MSPKIDNHTAGIRVNGAEQRPKRVVKPDHENARAERLQIFRHEPHPELFARADHKNREQQNDEIAFQSEKIRETRKQRILQLARRVLLGRWRIGLRFHLGLVRLLSSKPRWIVDLVSARFAG